MYHAIVQRIVRSTWKKVDDGDLDAPWRLAADDLEFTFAGTTPLSGTWVGRDHLRQWLRDFTGRFDELHFVVEDVAVSGWPWRTTVATRLRVEGRWHGGDRYDNVATQWITLRWGKMTHETVLEDTQVLVEALRSRSGA